MSVEESLISGRHQSSNISIINKRKYKLPKFTQLKYEAPRNHSGLYRGVGRIHHWDSPSDPKTSKQRPLHQKQDDDIVKGEILWDDKVKEDKVKDNKAKDNKVKDHKVKDDKAKNDKV